MENLLIQIILQIFYSSLRLFGNFCNETPKLIVKIDKMYLSQKFLSLAH